MRLAANVARTLDVDGMLDQMTLRQFAKWEAFDRIEPIGSRPLETVLSLIGAVVAQAAGGKMKPKDFTPWIVVDDKPGEVSSSEIKAAFQQITGGR